MTDFISSSAEFTGHFTVQAPTETVFEIFSPLGERSWAPDWSPELLYPAGVRWERNQIFRTQEESGEAIWIVTELNISAHEVEYHRVEPHRYVARIRVKCSPMVVGTEVSTKYAFVGLSPKGNEEIGAMTTEQYSAKMKRWEQLIGANIKSVRL